MVLLLLYRGPLLGEVVLLALAGPGAAVVRLAPLSEAPAQLPRRRRASAAAASAASARAAWAALACLSASALCASACCRFLRLAFAPQLLWKLKQQMPVTIQDVSMPSHAVANVSPILYTKLQSINVKIWHLCCFNDWLVKGLV